MLRYLLIFVVTACAWSQAIVSNQTAISGVVIDNHSAGKTLPHRTGTGSPNGRDNCSTIGETYVQTDATAGQNLFVCTTTGTPGTWTVQGGSGAVSSVFTRTGAVTAQTGDYTAAQVTNAFDLTANNALGAHAETFTDIATPANPSAGTTKIYSKSGTICSLDSSGNEKCTGQNLVTSVFTRTGAVTAQTGDYTAAQVTNAADKTASNTYTAGAKQIFQPSASTAGERIVAGALPSTPATGDLAIDSGDSNKLKFWDGSVWQTALQSVTSVFTRTGAVTAQTGDYTAAQVTNAFDLTANNALGAHSETFTDIATPANPSAGQTKFYSKSGALCSLDSAGNEKCTGTGGGTGNAAAFVTTTFSATPTFTAPSSTAGTVVDFELSTALTANITSSTFSGPTTGEQVNFRFCQDGTGGRTVAMPTGFDALTVDPRASACTTAAYYWNGSAGRLLSATGAGWYSTTVTAQTSVSISGTTHGQGTLGIAQCFDNSSPRVAVNCSYTRDSSNGNLVFTFSPAFTGMIEVLGGAAGGGGGGGTGTIQSINNTPQTGIIVTNPTGPNTLVAPDPAVLAKMDQLQYFKQNVCSVSVAGSALSCNIATNITSYLDSGNPLVVMLKMANTLSTGTYTLSVNGLSNLSLMMPNFTSTIATNAIRNGLYYLVYYAGNGAGVGPCTGSTDCWVMMNASN